LHSFRVPIIKAAEAAEMICCTLDEDDTMTYTTYTYKNWYEISRRRLLTLKIENGPNQAQKFEDEQLQRLLNQNSAQTEK
jgi:hypothetical protein